MNRLSFFWVGLTFFNLCSLSTGRPPKCNDPYSAVVGVAREIEVERTSAFSDLITTNNGKVSGALETRLNERGKPSVPKFLRKYYPELTPEEILDMPWDKMYSYIQTQVIEFVSEGHDYGKSRLVPGLKFKDTLQIVPDRNLRFLGKSYQAGKKYDVDLTGFLLPEVEFASAKVVPKASFIELHFRGKVPSKLRKEIETFFELLEPEGSYEIDPYGPYPDGFKTTPLADHVHIPERIPTKFFSKLTDEGYDPQVGPALLTVYHQMTELAVLVESAKAGAPPVKQKGSFNYLFPESIPKIFSYFSALQRGENPRIGRTLRKNSVAVRGHDTYTEENLWGLEVRFPGWEFSGRPGFNHISDGIKTSLKAQDFSIEPEYIAKFVKENRNDLAPALANLWFRKTPQQLLSDHETSPLKKEVREVISHWKLKSFEPKEEAKDSFASLLPLLLMRWDTHPLVKNNSSLKARVAAAQTKYLATALTKPPSPEWARKVVLDFLEASGLSQEIDRIVKLK